MQGVKITAPTISGAIKSFLEENSLDLNSVSANLISEKVFTDGKEYTLEMAERVRSDKPREPATGAELDFAKKTLEDLLKLMYFEDCAVTLKEEAGLHVLYVEAREKDGLLIGKNGQNLLALQYLLSVILDRNLHRHIPLIVDVDSYREKRVAYLRSLSRSLAEKAETSNSEVITDFLPPYERKLIHEELASMEKLRTFSVGRGVYKKVVITPLL